MLGDNVMTRINVVPPETLSREHLLGEYHEVLRPLNLVRKAQLKGVNVFNFNIFYKVPLDYVLGTGHVIFFYNKLGYIIKRYRMLQAEMTHRGYNFTDVTDESLKEGIHPSWFGDYEPTENAIAINTTRLIERTK